MGSICSCLCVDDLEGYALANGSVSRRCICLGGVTRHLIYMYTSLIHRGEVRSDPSSMEETTSLSSVALVVDDSFSDTYCSPPRPLPYDDPRYSPLQRRELVLRCDKSGNFQGESEPFRSNNGSDTELKTRAVKSGVSDLEGGSELCCAISPVKNPQKEVIRAATYIFSSDEDEDLCPTCLEEYTTENPRIILQCSHHYHLGCIYEWMERSEACPVCGKVMVFSEAS